MKKLTQYVDGHRVVTAGIKFEFIAPGQVWILPGNSNELTVLSTDQRKKTVTFSYTVLDRVYENTIENKIFQMCYFLKINKSTPRKIIEEMLA